MLSLVLATIVSAHPVSLIPPQDSTQPTLNERLFGNDPAIQAEVNKIDHTRHYISLGLGAAFVLSGAAMLVNDNKFGGAFVMSIGLPISLLGGMGLLNLSE